MFIAFEGIDGTGKTTHAHLLGANLVRSGYRVLVTKEPSGNWIGSLVRHVVHKGEPELSEVALAILYAADRALHLERDILPTLHEGKSVVICDRYVMSSLAYQGSPEYYEWIQALNKMFPNPHLTFLLDCPVDVALERKINEKWRYQDAGFLELARQKFLAEARCAPDRVYTVATGGREVQEVAEEILNITLRRLGR